MSKKNIGLFLVLAALGAIYVFKFTNIFQERQIEIASRIRPPFAKRGRPVAPGNTISFSLNGKYELTSLKVVEAADLKTNKYPHAIWHLVSESNSVPTKAIIYGVPVEGMRSEVAKLKPGSLRTNVPYVLLLEAGKLKGQTTFQMR